MTNVIDINYHLQQYTPDLSISTDVSISEIISGIENDQKHVYEQSMVNFLVKEYKTVDINELKEGDRRQKLWNSLTKLMKKTNDNEVLTVIFMVFRIVSRDKGSVNKLVTQEWLELMMTRIGLCDTNFDYSDHNLCKIEEGQKVLWNVLFNSIEQVEASIENGLLNKVINRIRLCDKVNVPDVIKFYDTKFIFYMTARSTSIRRKVEELDGLILFITMLKVVLKEASESSSQRSLHPVVLDDCKADIACESLKALFNLTLTYSMETDKVENYKELVVILRNYLLLSTVNLEKTWQLRNDIVNLLTNVPPLFLSELITPIDESAPLPKTLRFENQNMNVIYEMLMFLEVKVKDQSTVGRQMEIFSPVLTVLLKGALTHRPIRKYLRMHILPPLKDMDKRPEENDTLRGHLCKLLTTPITQIRDLVAELLFVLCKCNVSRMIKYTGYGNAAGLFAQRGLLGGEKDAAEADYSSDSEGSETEEYTEQKHLINPVLGCVEHPHGDPMKGMTDEQKEYEAMQLADRINSLANSGIIQPCRVGADGKPHPIEHVLELQEGLKAQCFGNNNSDSE